MTKKKAFPLRIHPDLYAALERWAADDLRSVNGQIEYLLWDAVRKAGRTRPAAPYDTPDERGDSADRFRAAPGDDAE